jgi:hypothetical protein
MTIARCLLILMWLCVTANAAPDTTKRFIILGPERFRAALDEFVRYKQQDLPTEFVALEGILQREAGVDDPEKVKRFLYREWHERKLGYALLVGDADVFPVRYMVLDRVTPAAFDYAFYPSDLYYSDLAKSDGTFDDWNGQKQGFHALYFGEVRGEKNKGDPINYDNVDYRPDIAVGRWPVSTADEVKLVAAKSMRYEQSQARSTADAKPRAAFIAVGGWVDARPLLEKLSGGMPAGWNVEKRFYHDGDAHFDTPPPTEEAVRRLLNDGVALVAHAGHGSDLAWERCFSIKHLNQVTNAEHLPVIISAGCSTARLATLPPYEPYVDVNGKVHEGTDQNRETFTEPPPPPACYQTGRFNPTGMGEQLLRAGPDGAAAYIGCNTGSQPCGLTLLEGFILAIQHSPRPRLGDCWASAVTHYYEREHLATIKPTEDWYPASIFFQGMKFMVFGDPTLKLPPPAPRAEPAAAGDR